jgi:hypothetical protein
MTLALARPPMTNENEPEAGRPRVLAAATYRSGTPRNQHRAVARHATHTPRKRLALRERLRCAWHDHLHDLATASRTQCGLRMKQMAAIKGQFGDGGLQIIVGIMAAA